MPASVNKALISGGAGFLGSHVCERLVKQGNYVVALDNLSTGSRENLSSLEGHRRFEFVEGDVLDKDIVHDALQDCSIVFHLAASRDVRLGAQDTEVDFKQNLVGTHTILECIKASPRCRKIIFTSTSTVYGEASIIPTPETYGPLQPLSLYGASKLGCEGMISAYSHLFEIQAVVCRLANVVGPRCNHGIVPDLMSRVLKDEQRIDILGNGKQRKSYLYVDDCIDALSMFLHTSSDGVEIFNVGSSDTLAVTDIVSIIKKVARLRKGSIERYDDHGDGRGWPGDVRNMLLDCKKIESAGWTPKFSSANAVELAARSLYPLAKGDVS